MTTGLSVRTGVRTQKHQSLHANLKLLSRSLEVSSANPFVCREKLVSSTASVKLQPWSQQMRRGWIVSQHLDISTSLVSCVSKLFWPFWISLWVSPIQVFINIHITIISVYDISSLHLVGYWDWTSPRKRVYLRPLSPHLKIDIIDS